MLYLGKGQHDRAAFSRGVKPLPEFGRGISVFHEMNNSMKAGRWKTRAETDPAAVPVWQLPVIAVD
jgi:hypothetical protein